MWRICQPWHELAAVSLAQKFKQQQAKICDLAQLCCSLAANSGATPGALPGVSLGRRLNLWQQTLAERRRDHVQRAGRPPAGAAQPPAAAVAAQPLPVPAQQPGGARHAPPFPAQLAAAGVPDAQQPAHGGVPQPGVARRPLLPGGPQRPRGAQLVGVAPARQPLLARAVLLPAGRASTDRRPSRWWAKRCGT